MEYYEVHYPAILYKEMCRVKIIQEIIFWRKFFNMKY
jgi:hypothetical protein